uniref:cysteine peptidase family C39 domain-containing protein n=1 Tax=Marinobacterium profundum TaxID=1714300 RepID=UPI00131599AC|nr:cysteine peptidase family C39 domain-containing protein [Marinobacterium profundum]
MNKNQLVVQEDEWGCGVACVASLLGITYIDAMDRLQEANLHKIDFANEGLELEPIISVLKKAGMRVSIENNLKLWPIGTIAFLNENDGDYKGSGHYLLRTTEGWMDPWYNVLYQNPQPRQAKFRKLLPRNTSVQAALVPEAG